jgi:hypothetical protein
VTLVTLYVDVFGAGNREFLSTLENAEEALTYKQGVGKTVGRPR